jgi:hypothetical protein
VLEEEKKLSKALDSGKPAANELIRIVIGDLEFTARLERGLAPKTCEAFCAALPFSGKLVQARWSGEAAWIPLGKLDLGVGLENARGTPRAGEILFHPADHSECEILVPYGKTVFRCKDGDLKGNHFLTIVEGIEKLTDVGELVLRRGSQEVTFAKIG